MAEIFKYLWDLSFSLVETLKIFIDWWFIKIDISLFGQQLFYNSPIELFLGGGLVAVVAYLVIRIFI